ncbi:hypothetical protein MFLO_14873 [Listeria floridensis FSL S10-1187]|uniref:Major facilitator superfamily (MFS) profile domain-containing protein n=1 Tax=Listeria floridensis FSL S10-1187 TaxID=1265817 RepID=A0ABN0RC07_9LIST|nr:hypothetical protein MFLO_14873 [Listeria floridensis FSL S10-1187]
MTTSKSNKSLFLLLILFIGYTCVYVDKYTIGISLVSVSQDLGFNPSEKGIILGAFFLGYTIMQIPMGYLSNRFGPKPVLVCSLIGVGLFLMIFGVGFSLLFLVVIRFLTGALAHSGYPPSVSGFIAANIPTEKKGFAQTIMLSSSGFAMFVGPLLVAPLLTAVGWRTTYYIMGGIVIVIALLLFFALPKPSSAKKESGVGKVSLPFSKILKDPAIWVLIVSAFLINASVYGLTSWLASYLNETRGLPIDQVSYVSSLTGIFILVAGVGGGYIIGRYFRDKEKSIIIGTAIIGALCIYGVFAVQNLTAAIALLCVSNMICILTFSTLMSLPHSLFKPEEIATKYATVNAGGVFGGFFAQ